MLQGPSTLILKSHRAWRWTMLRSALGRSPCRKLPRSNMRGMLEEHHLWHDFLFYMSHQWQKDWSWSEDIRSRIWSATQRYFRTSRTAAKVSLALQALQKKDPPLTARKRIPRSWNLKKHPAIESIGSGPRSGSNKNWHGTWSTCNGQLWMRWFFSLKAEVPTPSYPERCEVMLWICAECIVHLRRYFISEIQWIWSFHEIWYLVRSDKICRSRDHFGMLRSHRKKWKPNWWPTWMPPSHTCWVITHIELGVYPAYNWVIAWFLPNC